MPSSASKLRRYKKISLFEIKPIIEENRVWNFFVSFLLHHSDALK